MNLKLAFCLSLYQVCLIWENFRIKKTGLCFFWPRKEKDRLMSLSDNGFF